MSYLTFRVYGEPQQGGSKRAFPAGGRAGGRTLIVDDNPKLKPWQHRVAGDAAEAMQKAELGLFDEPVRLTLRFYVVRPSGHYNTKGDLNAEGQRHPYPAKRPDLTKLVRGIEDAMTGVVWRDDARVVQQETCKVWGELAGVEVEVEPARPFRPNEEPELRLRRLNDAIGETAADVDRYDHLSTVLSMTDGGVQACRCGTLLDALATICPACGRATFTPYTLPAKRAAGVPLEPERFLQGARIR